MASISKGSKEDSKLFAAKLELGITSEKAIAWAEGNESTWCLDSYRIAKSVIYKDYEPGPADLTQTNLGNAYYQQMRPIVEEQLQKAGVRFARLLNVILGGW